MSLKKYIGTKKIEAVPMTLGSYESNTGCKSPNSKKLEKHSNGYLVRYSDGYISWSPKKQFEDAYRESGEMTFGHAIEMLKDGYKVSRSGWNGKGMFLYYVPAASYPPSTEIAKNEFDGKSVPYGAYIAKKTAQGNVVPWLASQTDMLAEDWTIVE